MTTSPDPFFGELYLRTTRPFLSDEVTEAEGAYLRQVFAAHAPQGPLIDLGCGHGRHLPLLTGTRPVFGVDRDLLSLTEAKLVRPVVRADLMELPFRDGSLAGAWAWYNSICTFADLDFARVLHEAARALKPKGLLVIHTSPREKMASQPDAHATHTLPDGSELYEEAHYDEPSGRDMARRQLTFTDGRVMAAEFFVRYYSLPDLLRVLEAVGFRPLFAHGGIGFEEPIPEANDLIVGVTRG